MKTTNRYRYVYITKEGTGEREVRADNRRAAAAELKCPLHEVEYLETVEKSQLERRADHAARTPICDWDLDRIRDSNLFRINRPRKGKAEPKQKGGRRK